MTGTYRFVSSILNIMPVESLISGTGGSSLGSASRVDASVVAPFLDHVKTKLTSKLISGISKIT